MRRPINVLVADDSGLMRLIVTDMLNADPELRVVDTAGDGREAAQKTALLRPDVLVLDMTMEHYDGLFAVREVMAHHPTPIVILSALGNTHLGPIMEALGLGAYDYLTKPSSAASPRVRELSAALVRKVKEAAGVDALRLRQQTTVNQEAHTFGAELPYDVIAIGASTGGPGALEEVITRLPGNLAVPVLIAQHMPATFVAAFAQRLDGLTPLEVMVGRAQTQVRPGRIIIAPGDQNMVVSRRPTGHVAVAFTDERFSEYNHPSVDALLGSVAQVYGARAIGVVLTGMGRDGTQGLLRIQQAGGYTVAQNEASSVVWGMPRAAAEAGAVRQVVPLADVAGFLVSCLA